MATAEFSKFAGILSAALSQHHLSGLWNSSTGILSPPLALFVVMLSKAHLTSHSRMSGSHHFMANQWVNSGNSDKIYIYFLCSKITADGDCIHEIKICLLLERKVITNLDSILKSRDITLPTKFHLRRRKGFSGGNMASH